MSRSDNLEINPFLKLKNFKELANFEPLPCMVVGDVLVVDVGVLLLVVSRCVKTNLKASLGEIRCALIQE